MTVVAPIREEVYMATKPRIGAVDQYIDDANLARIEADEAVSRMIEWGKALIRTGRISRDGYMIHVGRQVLGECRVARAAHNEVYAAHVSLRETPAIRRARRQERQGNEERRQRERRSARAQVIQMMQHQAEAETAAWAPSEVAA